MALLTRSTLKNFFRRGSFPTEVNFADLIDSTINKVDDGFAKSPEDGLLLSPQGTSKRLISFFENIRDKSPAWYITFVEDRRSKGLSIEDRKGNSRIFIRNSGNVGINTVLPNYQLEVNGTVGMQGRTGTFKQGEVAGDGRWHNILTGLDGVQAFEIMAQISGPKGRGRYAITHAIALSAFGRSRPAVRKTRAYYGWFWNRIHIRWRGQVHNYRLQIRTGSHYGLDDKGLPRMIKYNITRLWDGASITTAAQTPEPEVTAESLDL